MMVSKWVYDKQKWPKLRANISPLLMLKHVLMLASFAWTF